MSFVRTLGKLAIGLAVVKGIDNYRKTGSLAGMQKQFEQQGRAVVDQIGAMAERMGVAGGQQKVTEFLDKVKAGTAQAGAMPAGDAAAAGLGGLLAAMKSATDAGGKMADDMIGAMFGGTPVALAQEEGAKLMLRAMIQAAKADGEITPAETKAILGHLGDVSDEERAFVEAEMKKPLDPVALARDTQESMKLQVYATSLMAVKGDNAAESGYLGQLGKALGLTEEARARVHESMGLPRPA
jgi:uncharacterized membrane protein YebE (DUF533 family)